MSTFSEVLGPVSRAFDPESSLSMSHMNVIHQAMICIILYLQKSGNVKRKCQEICVIYVFLFFHSLFLLTKLHDSRALHIGKSLIPDLGVQDWLAVNLQLRCCFTYCVIKRPRLSGYQQSTLPGDRTGCVLHRDTNERKKKEKQCSRAETGTCFPKRVKWATTSKPSAT